MIIIGVSVAFLIEVIVCGLILVSSRNKKSGPAISPLSAALKDQNLAKEAPVSLETWQDPAGFTFSYQKSLKINPHEEDNTNYANLEISQTDKKGKIVILVNDAKYATLEDWLKNDQTVKNGSALDTQIDDKKAKKVALAEGKEITGFIDADQVLYLLEKDPDGETSWHQIYKTILDSFKLTPLEGESKTDFEDWLGGFETNNIDAVEPVETIE